MIGTNLSHFQITAKLGQGGMGEVYRAKDTKLGRQVAVKVLPKDFADDPERLLRFEREAKTLASLNHPGIVAVYSLESFETTIFIVMELVEGRTLADEVSAGRLSLARVFDLAPEQLANLLAEELVYPRNTMCHNRYTSAFSVV